MAVHCKLNRVVALIVVSVSDAGGGYRLGVFFSVPIRNKRIRTISHSHGTQMHFCLKAITFLALL